MNLNELKGEIVTFSKPNFSEPLQFFIIKIFFFRQYLKRKPKSKPKKLFINLKKLEFCFSLPAMSKCYFLDIFRCFETVSHSIESLSLEASVRSDSNNNAIKGEIIFIK